MALADQTEIERKEMHDMDQPITGPMKPYKPSKPTSPPHNPNRMIAPNTPAEGVTTRSRRSEARTKQTPDVEEETMLSIPTKGPLRVPRDGIAAQKSAAPTPSSTTRSLRGRPPPGASKDPSDEDEETESDAPRQRRRRRKPGKVSSDVDSSEGDKTPSDPGSSSGREHSDG